MAITAPYFHDGRYPNLRALIPAKLKFLEELGSTEQFTDLVRVQRIAFDRRRYFTVIAADAEVDNDRTVGWLAGALTG